MRIGIIYDTHNLLRPEIAERLRGCDKILHCGDISSRSVLDQLKQIARVMAVRGTNDKEWAECLPDHLDFELGGLRIYMTHKKKDLPKDLQPYDLVLTGHSHQYADTWMEQPVGHRTRLLNPGSCGPRRFYQAITMALLTIDEDGWKVERIEIAHKEAQPEAGRADMRKTIETVVGETRKGRAVDDIVRKHQLDASLVEQIVRLYLTHPGVTTDGIMTKMGM